MAVNDRKAAIAGLGFVGSASAFALMQSGLFSELVLVNRDTGKAEGEALDISHGLPFARPMKIYAGTYGARLRGKADGDLPRKRRPRDHALPDVRTLLRRTGIRGLSGAGGLRKGDPAADRHPRRRREDPKRRTATRPTPGVEYSGSFVLFFSARYHSFPCELPGNAGGLLSALAAIGGRGVERAKAEGRLLSGTVRLVLFFPESYGRIYSRGELCSHSGFLATCRKEKV